ncbi:hypothetical protein RchiOBHm_Chr2g0158071 [Rosa chinensis]|uniref:Uncharacterized protein n=1 Tax=Rosa chinensis TaxID=74649 RepID=A0A2P6S1W5_ROSCH|nr:hypothetical protein RchiOBHm_Chr2g0158071 [Rosa chinensis]
MRFSTTPDKGLPNLLCTPSSVRYCPVTSAQYLHSYCCRGELSSSLLNRNSNSTRHETNK